MTRALAWLRRRWWLVLAVLAVVAYFAVSTVAALNEASDRRESRDSIEALAEDIKAQGDRIESATSDEERAASAARLAATVAELRRETVCAALYVNDERPAACADVIRRMDAIRAGADPFTRPPSSPPSSG